MYILDKNNKSLVQVKKCSFKELNFKERQDLQEWIAKEPSSLGEDLLIIQKEFNGFAETRERLDLLALDKNGNLVIIENKLDDSGKDVTWQAIKYASYCAGLKKQDVINIYQKYLGPNTSAESMLSDFFEGKDLEDIDINSGKTSQRIILVAAHFTPEVLSTVAWLRFFNMRVMCCQVTPYKYGDNIFLDFDRVLPSAGTEDYLIKIANKEQNETEIAESTIKRHNSRQQFWAGFIEFSKEHNGMFRDNAVTSDSAIGKSVSSIRGTNVGVILGRDNCRVEAYINTGDKAKNKSIFDALYAMRDEFAKELPDITWQRLDDKISSRIRIDRPYSYLDPKSVEKIYDFFLLNSQKMMNLFLAAGYKLNLK